MYGILPENSALDMRASVNPEHTQSNTESALNRVGSFKLFRQMVSDKVVQILNFVDLLPKLR